MMKRRQFITLVGGAVVAWPLAARAQQTEQIRRIGVLTPDAEDDPGVKARLAGFQQGLDRLGWSADLELARSGDVGSGRHAGVIIDRRERPSRLLRRRREASEKARQPKAHTAFVGHRGHRHSDHRTKKCRREGSHQCASRGRRLFHMRPPE
jgi:hypothetical protein